MLSERVGFIGAGQMARALAGGFLRAELVGSSQIVASDPVPAAGEAFQAAAPGAQILPSNAAVAAAADVLVLAVKPQQMAAALADIQSARKPSQLVVSIAAGAKLATLAAGLGESARIIRVMPNTPCLVGQSASAYATGAQTTSADAALVERLLGSVGKVFRVDEKLLDAVTGLSGSGPAFVFVMIEALADGGVRVGLPRELALALAAQTVLGSAQMVLESGEHPAVLKDRVASPSGTTIAGLQALESGSIRSALIAAVEAATNRSIELGAS